MSTPSRWASSPARPAGRTLKPMITASEAMARFTSSWVIAPTPRPITRRLTSSPTSSLSSASSRASTEPDTSPLMMSSSSSRSPALNADSRPSSVTRRGWANWALRSRGSRRSAIWRAIRSSETTRKLSPAPGTAVRPSTMTGRDGSASLIVSPFSSIMARTRPNASPQTIESPTCSVPRCTSTVATGPRPLSRCASRATPWASWSGLARRSSEASAVKMIASSKVSMPVRWVADTSTNCVSAELLGDKPVLGELGPHPLRVGALLVDLVDRHHDRHAGRLRVVQRLGGLRLHAVVGRHHQHHEVGGLGAAGAHGGERLVARGVDEGDLPLVTVDLGGHLVGADVLGDAAGLAGHHVGVPDRVEQLGLAVVDMTHHRDHRRPGDQVGLVALVLAELDVEGLEQLAVLLLRRDDLDGVVQLRAEQLQGLVVDRLGRRDHLAQDQKHLDQRRRVGADLVGEVAQAGAPAEPDHLAVAGPDLDAADRRRLHVVELLTPLLLGLPAPGRTPAGTTEGTLGTAAAATAAARTRRPAAGPGARRSARTTGCAATARARARAAATAAGTAAGPGACSGTRAAAAAGTTT